MTLIWIMLIIKALCCVAVVAPTFFFLRGGRWLKQTFQARTERTLEGTLTKLSKDFHRDESFFANGVGLAADFHNRRFFIAARNGRKTQAAILPVSALQRVTTGEMNQNGFYDVYVELKVDDPKHPTWRLLLGENQALATAIKDTLARLHTA